MSKQRTHEEISKIVQANNLKLIDVYPTRGNYTNKYKIQCYCGNIYETVLRNIIDGKNKSCGCQKRNIIDYYTGKTFRNGITVESFNSRTESGELKFNVKCHCGNCYIANIHNLKKS